MRSGRLCIKSLMLLPIVLVQLFFLSTADAQCLLPNGTANPDPYYQPCSNDTSNPLHTICCAIGRPTAPGGVGETRDVCMSNGLCQNSAKTSASATVVTSYFRDSCTEKDWNSGKCLNVCTDDPNVADVQLTPCDGTATSTTWCCGNTKDCCANSPVIIPKSFVVDQVSSTSSSIVKPSSSTRLSSTSTHPASSAKPASTSPHASTTPGAAKDRPDSLKSKSSLSGAAIIGIVIGALFALAIACTASYYIATRRRRAQGKAWPGRVSLKESSGGEEREEDTQKAGTSRSGPQAVEMEPSNIRYELPGTQKPLELP